MKLLFLTYSILVILNISVKCIIAQTPEEAQQLLVGTWRGYTIASNTQYIELNVWTNGTYSCHALQNNGSIEDYKSSTNWEPCFDDAEDYDSPRKVISIKYQLDNNAFSGTLDKACCKYDSTNIETVWNVSISDITFSNNNNSLSFSVPSNNYGLQSITLNRTSSTPPVMCDNFCEGYGVCHFNTQKCVYRDPIVYDTLADSEWSSGTSSGLSSIEHAEEVALIVALVIGFVIIVAIVVAIVFTERRRRKRLAQLSKQIQMQPVSNIVIPTAYVTAQPVVVYYTQPAAVLSQPPPSDQATAQSNSQ